MSKFDKVKGYYDMRLWDRGRVQNAVSRGWITTDEYREITGEEYAAQGC
ncbi:MAG: XkdX family protein [Intestinimonas sp.]|jgi:hypothetical protein|nr:XkdX family protein [Intestinimonas sp.]